MAARIRSKNWCFTLWNPDMTEELLAFPGETYCVWQLEQGAYGNMVDRCHFQGYVELSRVVSLSALKAVYPTAHFEPRKGSQAQAREYCMKAETRVEGPWERGTPAEVNMGKRNDLAMVMVAITNGASKRDIYEQYPDIAAKYPKFVDQHLTFKMSDSVEKVLDITPRGTWQKSLLKYLDENEPSSRQIIWIYDPRGGAGKTFMSRHLVDKYGAFYTNGGKAVDICYGYSGQKVVVFDYVRDSEPYVGYGVIEQLKNGILFSTKYESGVKRFGIPHVFVFANFVPDQAKMSQDRWVIVELQDDDRMQLHAGNSGAAMYFS